MDPQQQRLPVPTLLPWKGRLPAVADDAFIAPTAVLIGDVAVGPGSGVFYGTVVRGDRSALWVVHETCQQADPGPRFPVVVQGRGPVLYTVDRRRRAEAVRLMRRQWLAPARWECREVGFER